jgi:polar amino acid transport system substrate-binding protein
MNRRNTLLATALLGCLGMATACGTSSPAGGAQDVPTDCKPASSVQTVTPGVLTIGVINSLPYSSLNPISQEWEGMDADFGKAIAARECLKVNAITVGGADAVQSLSSGKLDLLSAGAYITPARGEVLGQTDPLYYQYTVATSKTPLSSLDALKGKKVGTQQGSAFVDPLKAALGADSVREYPTVADELTDVENGRIDVAVSASGEAKYQVDKAGYKDLQVTQLETGSAFQPVYGVDMPFNKSNTAMGQAINDTIKAMRAANQVTPILEKWKQNDSITLNGK